MLDHRLTSELINTIALCGLVAILFAPMLPALVKFLVGFGAR